MNETTGMYKTSETFLFDSLKQNDELSGIRKVQEDIEVFLNQ